jgi:hypothetical protein
MEESAGKLWTMRRLRCRLTENHFAELVPQSTLRHMSAIQLPVVYADESNNTGENLQDVNQPVFTVAGVHLDDLAAQDLVDQVSAALQAGAGEPKYTLLRKRPHGREALRKALEKLPPNSVSTFVADKKFMVISKIVDLGPEPMAMDMDYNMHADGSAHALANLVAATGPVLGDATAFENVLNTFVSVVRERPGFSATAYVKAARAYLATIDPGQRDLFRTAFLPDPAWLHELMFQRALGGHPDELDPAIPSVAAMCAGFEPILGSFKLIHDHSKVIERAKWAILNVHNMPDVADPSKLSPSIGVTEIEFGDSKDHAQLQIADWVAGFSKDVATVQWHGAAAEISPKDIEMAESWLASGPLAIDQELVQRMSGLSKQVPLQTKRPALGRSPGPAATSGRDWKAGRTQAHPSGTHAPPTRGLGRRPVGNGAAPHVVDADEHVVPVAIGWLGQACQRRSGCSKAVWMALVASGLGALRSK